MTAFVSQWAGWQPKGPNQRTDKTDKRCPPGGQVVLLEVPEGVPEAWAQGVVDLLAISPHPDWPEDTWKTLQRDAGAFLRAWGAQAHQLGWDAPNLFSAHHSAPHARLDGMGLVPLLSGRVVIALTEESAVIRSGEGKLTYHRRQIWPPGCCLLWDLAS